MKNNELIIWGDNWWVEKDNVWFVWGMQNIICCLDLKTMICELVVNMPNKLQQKFRSNPFCIKYQDDLYCMPVYGESIWIYNTISQELSEIFIDNQDKRLLDIQDFWKFNNKIYVVSNGLGQIIEINPKDKKIINYYQLSKKCNITKSIKVDSVIYCLFEKTGEVYQFDLITKGIVKYKLPNIERRFNTICFDGQKFWLSGYCKEVYQWDKTSNEIKVIDDFPNEFGIYNFTQSTNGEVDCITSKYNRMTFLHALHIGNDIWFIPYTTNIILRVDKQKNIVYSFEVDEEIETKESILARTELGLYYKYLFEYIIDNRYLGLYSLKNKCILEIDTIELKYEYKKYNYNMNDKYLMEIAKLYNNVFYEANVWSRVVVSKMLDLKNNICGIENKSIGANIYQKV